MAMNQLERLGCILDILRKECPWDRVQTIESLRYLTIEEVYELSDAIVALHEKGGAEAEASNLKKELGDLLMHILFYSKIAEDRGLFGFEDVAAAVSDKLVSRHPHIALPERDGKMRQPTVTSHPGWEQVKMKEGRKSVLEGVPKGLPALVKAIRLQEKAAGIGFPGSIGEDCPKSPEKAPVAVPSEGVGDPKDWGDYLFALVDYLRRNGINADEALSEANRHFFDRVAEWEQHTK